MTVSELIAQLTQAIEEQAMYNGRLTTRLVAARETIAQLAAKVTELSKPPEPPAETK